MLEDITNSIKAQLYDRAVSPLMGSYIISWCAWNHKALLLVWKEDSFSEVHNTLLTILYPFGWDVFWAFVAPLIGALTYIYAYPVIAKWAYRVSAEHDRDLRNMKKSISETEILSKEDSLLLKKKSYELEAYYQEVLDQREKQIRDMQVSLDDSRDENSVLSEEVSALHKKFSDAPSWYELAEKRREEREAARAAKPLSSHEISALNVFKGDNSFKINDFLNQFPGADVEGRFALSELKDRGLVRVQKSNYSLTKKGLSYVVNEMPQVAV